MPRQARLDVLGELYHVIARGNERKRIFREKEDYRTYAKWLQEHAQRDAMRLYAFCLMPNHLHLLLEPTRRSLGRFMHSLHTRYTRYFNRKYRRVGHLFQGRFRSLLCQKDAYLLELVRYIHLNPVRAKLVRSASQYGPSSYRMYFQQDPPIGLERDLVLGLAGGPAALEHFMQEQWGENHPGDFYSRSNILGGAAFLKNIQAKTGRHLPETQVRNRRPSHREIEEQVRKLVVPRASFLWDRDRSVTGRLGRALYATLAREIGGHSTADIARWMKRDPTLVSRLVRWFEQQPNSTVLFNQAARPWHKV